MNGDRRWWLGLGLLAVAGGWLLWSRVAHWSSFHWPVRGGLPWGEADIVALGDSVTYGDGVPARLAYPALLAEALARRVRNAGVVGDTAPGGLERLERDALRYRPSIVLIGFGLNDSELYAPFVPQTDPAHFQGSLVEMVRQVREAGAVPMLLSPPPVDADRAREGGLCPKGWEEYDRLVRQVAEDEAVALVDLAAAFGDDFGLLADGVHPTAEGQARIAAAVLAGLEGKSPPSPPELGGTEGGRWKQ